MKRCREASFQVGQLWVYTNKQGRPSACGGTWALVVAPPLAGCVTTDTPLEGEKRLWTFVMKTSTKQAEGSVLRLDVSLGRWPLEGLSWESWRVPDPPDEEVTVG